MSDLDLAQCNVFRLAIPANGKKTVIVLEPELAQIGDVLRGVGLDVSRYQPWTAEQWQRVVEQGRPDFAFLKCSQGDYLDPYFERHWANSGGVARRGVYHYLDQHYSPAEQARAIRRAIADKKPEWVAIDVEEPTIQPALFTELVKELAGLPLVVYTRAGIWNALRVDAAMPLWVASYRIDAPVLPNGFSEWLIWQAGVTVLPGGLKADVNFAGQKPEWWQVSRLGEAETGPFMGKCGPAQAGALALYDKPGGAVVETRQVSADTVFDQYGAAFAAPGWVCVYDGAKTEFWCRAGDLKRR